MRLACQIGAGGKGLDVCRIGGSNWGRAGFTLGGA